jgi:hypothetical protein
MRRGAGWRPKERSTWLARAGDSRRTNKRWGERRQSDTGKRSEQGRCWPMASMGGRLGPRPEWGPGSRISVYRLHDCMGRKKGDLRLVPIETKWVNRSIGVLLPGAHAPSIFHFSEGIFNGLFLTGPFVLFRCSADLFPCAWFCSLTDLGSRAGAPAFFRFDGLVQLLVQCFERDELIN